MIINYNEHYGDPNIGMGCMPDERPLQVQGITGDICAPSCTFNPCPTDKPAGVTADPQCSLEDPFGNKYCCLVCDPSSTDDSQCGENDSCKPIANIGICTYDDMEDNIEYKQIEISLIPQHIQDSFEEWVI